MSTCTSRSFIERIRSSVCSCESFENATIDPLDVEQAHERREPLDGPSSVRFSRSSRRSFGCSVDEADEVDPVLRMLQELLARRAGRRRPRQR